MLTSPMVENWKINYNYMRGFGNSNIADRVPGSGVRAAREARFPAGWARFVQAASVGILRCYEIRSLAADTNGGTMLWWRSG